jgi:hypothetical protein
MTKPADKPKKPRNISPEARARQLAGLSGVKVEKHVPGVIVQKVNGKGSLASVTDDVRKEIIDLYCQGFSVISISEKVKLGVQTVEDVKNLTMERDTSFREAMHKHSLKEKMRVMVHGVTDRIMEELPTMTSRDLVLCLGIAVDKLNALEAKHVGVEQLHQHVHLDMPGDIAQKMLEGMKQKP